MMASKGAMRTAREITLYRHVTDGGAEYLCSEAVPGTDEGDMSSRLTVRLDGEPTYMDKLERENEELKERLQALVTDQDIFSDNDVDETYRCCHCGEEAPAPAGDPDPVTDLCHNPECPAVKARALLSRIEGM